MFGVSVKAGKKYNAQRYKKAHGMKRRVGFFISDNNVTYCRKALISTRRFCWRPASNLLAVFIKRSP